MIRKTIKVIFILLLITVGLLELGSLLVFEVQTGKSFSYSAAEQSRQERIRDISRRLTQSLDSEGLYVFHPYIGYAGRPGARPRSQQGLSFNQLEFSTYMGRNEFILSELSHC